MPPPATSDGLPDVGSSAVRTRDLILLCIFIFTLMYCWHERSYFDYRLEPTWFVQNSVREVARRGRKVLDLVPPLLTDLDENGRQELIALVSSDADDSDDGDEGSVADPSATFRLQLLDVYQDPSLVLDDVFHPRVMAGVPLSGSKTAAPVAMAAGPLTPADGLQPDGLIAVAFENLTVAAFSATPRDSVVARRWLVDLVNASSPLTGGGLTEAHRRRCPSDYVTRVHYERGADAQGGDVVVVSLSPAATPAAQRASCAAAAGGGDESRDEETVRVFALAAEDGQLLWQFHAGADDESNAALATALPQQPLSLDLREQLLRHGASRARGHGHSPGYHWQLFRSSLLRQLPFGWFSDEDEALHAAHFDRPARLGDVRTRSAAGDVAAGAGAAMKKPPQPKRATPTRRRGDGPRLKSLLKLPLAPLVGRAAANRSDAAPAVDPARRSLYLHAQQHAQRRGRRRGERDNVVVLRHSGGLHVLALQTGAPLASLALPAERLYADVDGDLTLDSFFFPFASAATAEVLGQTLADGGEDCAALCLSGLPPTAPLFNSTALCGLGHANRRTGGGAEATSGRRGRRGRRGGRGRRRSHGEHLPEATASFAHAAAHHAATDNSSGGGGAAAAATPVAVSYAVPLLLPRDRSLGAAGYATGGVDSMREAADKRLAAVVLSSVGVLTALDERGDVLWQDFSSCAPFPAQRRYPAFTPRVLLFDPFAGAAGAHAEELQLLMVVQESSLVLLSLTGQVLHTLRLPGRLASSAVLLGDENGDGVVDTLVLAGEAALLGYRVEVKPVLYPMFLPLAVLLGIAALVWLSKMQLPNLLAADDQRAALGDWWIKTTRATDSLHLD